MAKWCCQQQQQQTSLGLHIKCQTFCLTLNKLRFSLQILLSFPIWSFIKIHTVGDAVISADTQGDVSWARNDLQHAVLGVTYTVCRLKECSHHIACTNVPVVLRILSSSKQHLSSYNTHVNNNVTGIFKSAGSRNVVKQGYGAHASNPKQYIYSQFNNVWHVFFSDVLFSPSLTLKSQNPRTDVILLPPMPHIIP